MPHIVVADLGCVDPYGSQKCNKGNNMKGKHCILPIWQSARTQYVGSQGKQGKCNVDDGSVPPRCIILHVGGDDGLYDYAYFKHALCITGLPC